MPGKVAGPPVNELERFRPGSVNKKEFAGDDLMPGSRDALDALR